VDEVDTTDLENWRYMKKRVPVERGEEYKEEVDEYLATKFPNMDVQELRQELMDDCITE